MWTERGKIFRKHSFAETKCVISVPLRYSYKISQYYIYIDEVLGHSPCAR